ncbi:MAG: DUF2341 domain-containing protein [Thermoguttaceae bacterium]|nr:DUF2341 domain-containing protein [Thermoguttaceae bacterium]
MAVGPPGLLAGPFDAWAYRARIGINNASGTETLTNFPLLVSLNASNFDFRKAKADGTDLRFTTPTGALLSYEIEKWDPVSRIGLLWVKVPQIDPGSTAGYIQMYFGNPSAPDGQNVADVWSNGYVGVWHLGGTGTAVDSTGVHPGTVVGSGVTTTAGIIGDACSFAGDGSRITATGTALDMGNNLSITYWMKGAAANQPGGYTRVISKNTDAVTGWEYQRGGADANQNIRIDTATSGSQNNQVRLVGANAFDGNWHFIGTTIGSGTVRGYLDGGTPTTNTYIHDPGFGNTQPLTIAARVGGGNPFRGLIDEVRISNVVRSAGWMNAEYRSQSGQMSIVGPTQLASGLVAEYAHENPLNRTADSSGNNHHATAVGGVQFITPPSTGGFAAGLETTVASFSYTASQYIVPPASLLDPLAGGLNLSAGFTVTGLVYSDGTSPWHRTILSSNRFRWQQAPGGVYRLDITNTGGNQYPSVSGVFQDNTWYFVALRYDATGNLAQAYLLPSTGVLAGPLLSVNPTEPFTNISAFRIGMDGLTGIGGGDTWGGMIDNVRFFQGALTKRQLRDVFYSYTGYGGGPIGLVARYSHENPANRLADDTGNRVPATNRGAVQFVSPPAGGIFSPGLGTTVGFYSRQDTASLDFGELYTAGDDFTFTALVRKDTIESDRETILASNRFRLQFQNTGTNNDGAGQLFLQVNGAGSSGPTGSGAGTFLTDQWYFVALRYNASTRVLEAFLDNTGLLGPPDISQVVLGSVGLDDMVQFRVGADGLSGLGSTDPFGGWIDRIQFYDRYLSNAELHAILSASVPEPATLGLLALGLLVLVLLRAKRAFRR